MTGTLHVAHFGNTEGSHELLTHSGLSPEVLEEVQWYTDLPAGPQAEWQPFQAGFPITGHYVVRYTRPDTCARRAGMVATTVLIADQTVYEKGLAPLLDEVEREPDPEPLSIPARHESVVAPIALAGVIDGLATEGRVLWRGQDGFSEVVGALWEVLAPADRRRLVFGLLWHPGTIPYPVDRISDALQLYTCPPELTQRFANWHVIDPANPPSPGRIASAVLREDRDRGTQLASRLDLEQPTLKEWDRLSYTAHLTEDVNRLTGEQLRSVAHALASLAPSPRSGVELKDAVAERTAEVAPTSDFAHVRSLRTFPAEAYPSPPPVAELLALWASNTMKDPQALNDLSSAIDTVQDSPTDAWLSELEGSIQAAAQGNPPLAAARLANFAERDHRPQFEWLADVLPPEDVDDLLSARVPHLQVPEWLPTVAALRGWGMTHALTCAVHDPVAAWAAHIQVNGRNRHTAEKLASRTGPEGTVRGALQSPDGELTQLAGRLIAEDPTLLHPPEVTNADWRRVWSAAITAGADPWAPISPQEAVPQLLQALVDGQHVGVQLLEAAAGTSAADLSAHPQRRQVWSRLPASAGESFLNRTARAVARSTNEHLPSLEPELIHAILRPENLEAVAAVDVARAVETLQALEDRVGTAEVMAVVQGAILPQAAARQLGALTESRRLKTVARRLAELAYRRDDVVPAAERASSLLNAPDRLMIRLFGGTSPTSREMSEGLHVVATQLYPEGPMDKALWDRAGGDPADLPGGQTSRERWRTAMDAIENGARGAPALSALLDTMLEDYDRRDLKTIRDQL